MTSDRKAIQPYKEVEYVSQPSSNDILIARGRGSSSKAAINCSAGNVHFRRVVERNVHEFENNKNNKIRVTEICEEIFHTISNLDPPGRFLKFDEPSGRWFDIGFVDALKKVYQALYYKANPKFKKQRSKKLLEEAPNANTIVEGEMKTHEKMKQYDHQEPQPEKHPDHQVHHNDILLCKTFLGFETKNHQGNIHFRTLIGREMLKYPKSVALNDGGKTLVQIADAVMNRITKMDPPGRFLRPSCGPNHTILNDIGHEQAMHLILQSLTLAAEKAAKMQQGQTRDTYTLPLANTCCLNPTTSDSACTSRQTIPEEPVVIKNDSNMNTTIPSGEPMIIKPDSSSQMPYPPCNITSMQEQGVIEQSSSDYIHITPRSERNLTEDTIIPFEETIIIKPDSSSQPPDHSCIASMQERNTIEQSLSDSEDSNITFNDQLDYDTTVDLLSMYHQSQADNIVV